VNTFNQKSLGESIREFLKTYRLEEKLTETRITLSWEKVMGNHIAKYTQKVTLKKKVLYVDLTSSVMRNELMLAREKIIGMINKEVGDGQIEDVIFR
jgi:predicted nucleic acid-binding Zn ribbon protein